MKLDGWQLISGACPNVGSGSLATDWAVSVWRVVYSICSGCLS